MTQDFFLGQLRLIAVALITFASGKGWLTTDTTTLLGTILAPVGLLVWPWAWSIYRNFNSKIVPSSAVAISPDHVMNADNVNKIGAGGTAIITGDDPTSKAITAKVVG